VLKFPDFLLENISECLFYGYSVAYYSILLCGLTFIFSKKNCKFYTHSTQILILCLKLKAVIAIQ